MKYLILILLFVSGLCLADNYGEKEVLEFTYNEGEELLFTLSPEFNNLVTYSHTNTIIPYKKFYWDVEWIEGTKDKIIIHLKVKEKDEVE